MFCCCKRRKFPVEDEAYELTSSDLEGCSARSIRSLAAPSTLSSMAKNSHPVQRIRMLRANDSLPSIVSREGSVFVTPENTNPYYPNPNTPVEEEECGIVSMNAPFCPPNNTPIETSESESGSQSHLKQQVWCSFEGSGGLVMSNSESYVIVNNICVEEYHPSLTRVGVVGGAPDGTKSLSLHSGDINNMNAPIHSSTIAGADERSRRSCSLMATGFSNLSEELADNAEVTPAREVDVSKAVAAVDTNLQWHYNQAYEDEETRSTTDTGQAAGLYNSLVSSSGWRGSLSYQVTPSGHTSIIAQAGSMDLSSLISNYEPRCLSARQALYSVYTDSSLSVTYRPVIYSAPANTPQAPANSPLTVQGKSFEYYINRMSSSPPRTVDKTLPGAERGHVVHTQRRHRQFPVKVRHFHSSFRRTLSTRIFSPQDNCRVLHRPLLSPKTYWV